MTSLAVSAAWARKEKGSKASCYMETELSTRHRSAILRNPLPRAAKLSIWRAGLLARRPRAGRQHGSMLWHGPATWEALWGHSIAAPGAARNAKHDSEPNVHLWSMHSRQDQIAADVRAILATSLKQDVIVNVPTGFDASWLNPKYGFLSHFCPARCLSANQSKLAWLNSGLAWQVSGEAFFFRREAGSSV